MKLATKLVSIFMVLILVVIAADGWWSVREAAVRYERMQLEAQASPAAREALEGLRTSATVRSLRMAGALVFVSAVAGVYLGHRLLAVPLRALIDKTHRIGRGDLAGPVEINGRDELGELGAALNRVCDDLGESRARTAEETAGRIEAVEQLRHADRLRTVGQLAAGIAHEMGTPINVVSGRAGMIAGGRLGPEEVADSARTIKEQADRLSVIVRQLLDFARAGTTERAAVDMRTIVDRTIDLLAPVARKTGIEVSATRPDVAIEAVVDAGQIEQVLTNILINALQAMPDGGAVTVRVESTTASAPERPGAPPRPVVRVDVEDSGPGVPDDVADHVFDPFFTTKEVGQGTGMGLSVAHGIVREHGGWIALANRAGGGARFSVFLPRETAS